MRIKYFLKQSNKVFMESSNERSNFLAHHDNRDKIYLSTKLQGLPRLKDQLKTVKNPRNCCV